MLLILECHSQRSSQPLCLRLRLANRKESRAHRGRKRLTHRARHGSVAVGGVTCSDFAFSSSIADAHSQRSSQPLCLRLRLANRKESRAHRGRKRLTHRARHGSVAVGGVTCSDFAFSSSIADAHSHSIDAGGFVVTSKTTRLAWGTSLTIREETRAMRS